MDTSQFSVILQIENSGPGCRLCLSGPHNRPCGGVASQARAAVRQLCRQASTMPRVPSRWTRACLDRVKTSEDMLAKEVTWLCYLKDESKFMPNRSKDFNHTT